MFLLLGFNFWSCSVRDSAGKNLRGRLRRLLPRSKEKWTKRRGGWVRLIFCISSMLTPMFDHEFPRLWWNPRILMVKSLSSAKCSSVNPPGGCLPSLPGGGCACRLHQMVGISGASVEVYRAVEHEEFMKKVGCFSPNQVSRTSVLVDTWGLTLKNGSCLDRYPSYGDIFRQETWGTESDQVRSIRFYGDMGPHWDPIGTPLGPHWDLQIIGFHKKVSTIILAPRRHLRGNDGDAEFLQDRASWIWCSTAIGRKPWEVTAQNPAWINFDAPTNMKIACKSQHWLDIWRRPFF